VSDTHGIFRPVRSGRWPRFSTQVLLALLIILLLGPGLVFTGLLLLRYSTVERARYSLEALTTARQIAAVRATDAELRRSGDAPTDEAIAQRAGISQATVSVLRAAPHVSASLDQPVDDGSVALGELIADDDAPDAVDLAEQAETRRQLWAVLRLLPERHRQVLARRYGLLGDRAQTHNEIGAWLGVSDERSRQLEREALHRLRELGDRVPRAA